MDYQNNVTHTVGMYSPGLEKNYMIYSRMKHKKTYKAFVVYDISKQVLPTAPSPTTTHLIFL